MLTGLWLHSCQCGIQETLGTEVYYHVCGASNKSNDGPGTEIMALIAELGLKKPAGCRCAQRARQMDAWGTAGCCAHRAEIVAWLKESFAEVSWHETIAAAKALRQTDWFRPWDPFGSLVDEAIRHAAAKAL